MEILVFLAVLASVLALLFLNGIYREKRYWQGVRERLKRQYGEEPDKNWSKEQYEGIGTYHEAHKGDFCVDDITWNDLDMDSVFLRLDYTQSKTGAEYLYHTLRSPERSIQVLQKREAKIHYYRECEEERLLLQLAFARIGAMENYSLYEYLKRLESLEETGNAKHYACAALVFFTGALTLLWPGIGALLFLGTLCYNIFSYFGEKSRIEPYFNSLAYIMCLLENTQELQKKKLPGILEELEELDGICKSMRGFQRGAFWVLNKSGGAEPAGLLLDYIRMIFHLDFICFWRMRRFAVQNQKAIDRMLAIWGEMELAVNIGMVRASFEKAGFCIPEFAAKKQFCMEGGYYPLLPKAVRNSIDAEKGILLTGSNASGKSTFLKTCAVNVLLAQTIHTCTASAVTLCPGRLYSSMALRDDIVAGESYYMVEIKALKRILDAAREEKRAQAEKKEQAAIIYCFVDEVLRGTNTAERIAASTELLKVMAKENTLCFAATHDIELTTLLQNEYENYHFEEELGEEDVIFSYAIKKGAARTRNAIRLLRLMGYDAALAERAEKRAAEFLSTGKWNA